MNYDVTLCLVSFDEYILRLTVCCAAAAAAEKTETAAGLMMSEMIRLMQ